MHSAGFPGPDVLWLTTAAPAPAAVWSSLPASAPAPCCSARLQPAGRGGHRREKTLCVCVCLFWTDCFLYIHYLQLSDLILQFLLLISGLEGLPIQTFDLSHPTFHVQLQLPQLLVQFVLEPYLSGYLVLKQLDLLLDLRSKRQPFLVGTFFFSLFAVAQQGQRRSLLILKIIRTR